MSRRYIPLARAPVSRRRYRVARWPFLPPHAARALVKWQLLHGRKMPWRSCHDPFALLVVEMLLRQTNSSKVGPIWERLMAAYPDAPALAGAPAEELAALLRPLGLGNQRREALQAMAEALVRHHQGRVPAAPEALERLPHVGAYAARAVACFAFGLPVPLVDVNVIRVLDRFSGRQTPGKNPHRHARVWRRALRSLPEEQVGGFNYGLLDLGALVCRVRPRCQECPLRGQCRTARSDS